MECPVCHSQNVSVQVVQEQTGSKTVSRTRSKYKEKGHGILWWICIGWWWWAVDLCLWFFAFFPRLILRLFAAPFKKKKYEGQATTTATTKNIVKYRKAFTCQDCGHAWMEDA